MKDSLRLTLSRAVLLPLSIVALSCGGTPQPPPKDPPQATLNVPKPNTAGSKLTVQVSATGCDQIQSLSIYDRDTFLKSVPYSGPGVVPVDLLSNEIKYTHGIAAQLSLKARVVCTDGRQNDSQPQPATFFPAAEVVEAASGTQLVPDNFVTEGTLPIISFLGCGNAEGGIPTLYLVNKNGGVLNSKRMPFLCTSGTVITPRNPTSGKRWVWTPDAGAMAIDSNLAISARVDIPLDLLAVGQDGDAVISDLGSGGNPSQVARISHVNGAVKWSYTPNGFVINTPLPRVDDVMVASITTTGAPSGKANIVVSRVDYGRQNPATGGLELGNFVMKSVASDGVLPNSAPPNAFSPDGNLLYLSFTGLGNITQLFACSTQAAGCDGTAQRWGSEPPTLPAAITAMVPYAAGTKVAVLALQKVWFLDASTGAVLNKGGEPLIPEGGLIVLQVQSGAPPYAQAFYFLTGPAPQANLPAPQPLEIVATDDPAKGELYRYQVNAGSIAAAMDDSGTLWLRVGGDIVRPLTPPEYRQQVPVTP